MVIYIVGLSLVADPEGFCKRYGITSSQDFDSGFLTLTEEEFKMLDMDDADIISFRCLKHVTKRTYQL